MLVIFYFCDGYFWLCRVFFEECMINFYRFSGGIGLSILVVRCFWGGGVLAISLLCGICSMIG